jgi:glycosyltransferase involved in cell wall biosynthesis
MPPPTKRPNSSIRISFFLDNSHPTPGAPWARISSFAKALAKIYDVDVVGVFSPKSLKGKGIKQLSNMNILNFVFKVCSNNPLLFLFNLVVSLTTSTILLIARRPRLAIVSFPDGDSNSGFLIACIVLRIKVIVDYRDEWEDQLIYASNLSRKFYVLIKKVSSFFYRRACFVAVVTKPFVKALAKRGVMNIVLVPNGASCSSFKLLDKKPDKEFFTIVYSGGVGDYYRLDVVISSLKRLADRGLNQIRLLIVGRGTIDSVLKYARQLGVQDAVAYLGNKSNIQELSKIIAEANVGIVPYDDNPLWMNALPAKFFEYCACGLPVIATVYKNSILANLIHENEIGLTANPMDVNGLADAIEKMSGDKEFRVNAGKRARILIEQHFDRDRISEEFLNAICKIAEC